MTPRVTLERVRRAAGSIDPVFLRSPRFECEPLSAALGVRLVLKVETLNPIRCFKGRGADWLVSQAADGAALVCASAGNFGQAMAYACRRRGIPLTVYAATTANPLKVARMHDLGATVVLHGADFDAAKHEARRAAAAGDERFVEDGLDVETAEGAGSIGLELLEGVEPPQHLLVPLGNGALFNGVARVVKALSPSTRITAVQAAGAPAMLESLRQHRLVQHAAIDTIADGIGVRVPIPQALADMEGLVDDGVLVSDDSILAAMRLIHRHAGLVVEPSGAVGVAAILERPQDYRDRTASTILCGGNLTESQMRDWL
ncbi:MAG TPA: pyridoxal-phosphate dependent enzyme [Gemmatimonadales bacterium]|nr:pyridoxal-phosphate dependent enzyme [Gemmatimonadales bacterium]